MKFVGKYGIIFLPINCVIMIGGDSLKKLVENYMKKHSALNTITLVIVLLAMILYVIGLVSVSNQGYGYDKILSCSADYITIVSCILVLIQLVAFVKDARNKELRARKEYALGLAKEYAKDLLFRITMINNVVSKYYNPNDICELQNSILGKNLYGFTKSECQKFIDDNGINVKYKDAFEDGKYNIPLDIIAESYWVYFQENINTQCDDAPRQANLKFRLMIGETLNLLEYFTMSVNQNVAESDMIFCSLHQTYTKFVRFIYPMICKYNETEESYYTNIIELYTKWDFKCREIEEYNLRAKETQRKLEEKNTNRSKKRFGVPPLKKC